MPVPMAMVSSRVQTRELPLSEPAHRPWVLSSRWRKVETDCMQGPQLREFPSAKTMAQLGQIPEYPKDWASFLALAWTAQFMREPTSTEFSSVQRPPKIPMKMIVGHRVGDEWPGSN